MDIILLDLMLHMHPVNRLIRIESDYSGNLISVTPDILTNSGQWRTFKLLGSTYLAGKISNDPFAESV